MSIKRFFTYLFFISALVWSPCYGADPCMIKLDINNDANNDDANTQAGFTPFSIANSGSEVNGVAIDLGGDIQSARRTNPTGRWNGTPPVYYPRAGERIYRDFIYGISPGGVTITLWGLGANRECDVNIFAYDYESADANRVANWYANGTYIFDTNFKGGSTGLPGYETVAPQDLYKYSFSGTATTDYLGRIILTSSKDPCSPAGQDFAFVNALIVVPKGTYVSTNYAHRPVPFDGTNGVSPGVTLEWKKGGCAEKHDVYFGTDFNDVNDANRTIPLGVLVSQDHSTTTYDPPEFLDSDITYYWRIDEVNSAPDYTIFKGEVWSFTTYTPVLIASNPVPLDGEEGMLADATLSWTKGEYAEKHDVYFGTDQAKVTSADRSNPQGVLVSEGQEPNTYDPPGSLDFNTTYYWRIDEVNAAPDYTIFKGDLWSFRVNDWRYFGQTPPGATPQVFAPGIISLPSRYEADIGMSQDGGEYYFTVRNADWTDYRIYVTRYENGQWITPAQASFSNSKSLKPALGDNDQSLYFGRDADIWKAARTGSAWASPVKLDAPVSSSAGDWSCTISSLGNLWTCSWRDGGKGQCDMWWLEPSDGNFINPTNISINTSYNECNPLTGPNENYLLFNSSLPGGYGDMDLYISFPDGQGGWKTPRNLGPAINTSWPDASPYISPDHKYLFFSRPTSSSDTDIYWVDIRVLFSEADFSQDGRVDFEDLGMLAACWLTDEPSIDIAPRGAPDGIVNFLEFAVFAQHWLEVQE